MLARWRQAVEAYGHAGEKLVAQSLYIDLSENARQSPRPIHLGVELRREPLIELLQVYQNLGVNHVAFVLKFSRRPVKDVIEELAEEVVPYFPANPV